MSEPIFVVGCPRSGTTLVRNILNSHSKVWIAPETSYLFRLHQILWLFGDLNKTKNREIFFKAVYRIKRIKDWKKKGLKLVLSNTGEKQSQLVNLTGLIQDFYECELENQHKQIWGDKTPANLFQYWWIKDMFPNAKFVVVERNVFDTARSLNKADFGGCGEEYHVKQALEYHAFRRFLQGKQEDFYKIQYEDLCCNPKQEIKKLCKYCGIRFQKRMLTDHTKQKVNHFTSKLYGKPISTDSIKWGKYPAINDDKAWDYVNNNKFKVWWQGYNRFFNKKYLENYWDFFKFVLFIINEKLKWKN